MTLTAPATFTLQHPTFDAWIAAHGPYLYHLSVYARSETATDGVDVPASIRQHGLIPWDDPRSWGGQYTDDWYEPQPGCVYLAASLDSVKLMRCFDCWAGRSACCVPYQVDITGLNPDQFRFDEDLLETNPDILTRLGVDGRYTELAARDGMTLGRIAANIPVLHDPRLALLTLQSPTGQPKPEGVTPTGSCAYHGVIPAAAVTELDPAILTT